VIHRLARQAAALVAAVASVFLATPLFAAGEVPETPTRWVTDGAAFLSESARQELDARLQAYERQTGHQVLVWIGHTSAGVPIEDVAVKAFKAWGVGRRGQDDGLVLFIFADDHTARFEVGYGLEGSLPDITAGRIIREVLAPKIQAGDHDGAVSAAIEAATAAISGDASASGLVGPSPSGQESRGRGQPRPLTTGQKIAIGLAVLGFLVLLVTNPSLAFFLLQVIASGGGGRGGGGGGGGWSGGGGRSGGGGASGSW
jgi:uncharacterized protein